MAFLTYELIIYKTKTKKNLDNVIDTNGMDVKEMQQWFGIQLIKWHEANKIIMYLHFRGKNDLHYFYSYYLNYIQTAKHEELISVHWLPSSLKYFETMKFH